MSSAARTTPAPITIVANTEKPSTPTASASVENGPRSASCTRSHSGRAAPIAARAVSEVKAAYSPAGTRRRVRALPTRSSRAPPTRISIGAIADHATSTRGICVGRVVERLREQREERAHQPSPSSWSSSRSGVSASSWWPAPTLATSGSRKSLWSSTWLTRRSTDGSIRSSIGLG